MPTFYKEIVVATFGKPYNPKQNYPHVVKMAETYYSDFREDPDYQARIDDFLYACKGVILYRVDEYEIEGCMGTEYSMRFIEATDAIQFKLMLE